MAAAAAPTAEQFLQRLEALADPEKRRDYERFLKADEHDRFLGVRMGQVFALAKELIDMQPSELAKLLHSPFHEARVGALSVMNQQARKKKLPAERRQALYDLYLASSDWINFWDLVDLAAPHVVGGYLVDKPRDVLYRLACSQNPWERRTAIVSTAYFLGQRDVADTFAIAEILVHDEHDLVRKAVGGWLREAGKHDPSRLRRFLDEHAATMPRVTLRFAIEHFAPEERQHYLSLKRAQARER